MRNLFYFLFFVSGFAGLIYESIWSHYLKLFLGHAAYAQTLVLAIFMGGMAIGAAICGAMGHRWKNLLLGYALAEGLIGVAALVFHNVFDGTIQFAYQTLLPMIDSPDLVALTKWIIAAILILPQSILLGSTFPLMAAGIIRKFPSDPGRSIATLYFSNSIGASIGVLVSGFWLIELVGLPGTVRIGGLLNIILAVIVWRLARNNQTSPAAAEIADAAESTQIPSPTTGYFKLMLWVAGLTGAASFIYEIVWLRMLSLVLGSSTHAFELMLSAFILGLALGGLWIRRNIEKLTTIVTVLAIVQLVMGLLALSTLPLYDFTFGIMQWLTVNLPKTDNGFFLLNLSNHGIAMAVMLPTTFCAGMTLPLITYTLLKQGNGEKSIGAVYAANTVGAIIGVFFATHVGMPQLGIKGLLSVGGAIDMGLAVFLFYKINQSNSAVAKTPQQNQSRWIYASAGAMVVSLAVVLFAIELDIYKMSSGVYRTGQLSLASNTEILFHKDGKVATVDLQRDKEGYVDIRTNGKVDANIQMNPDKDISHDEPTMVLAGAIPMALLPNAKSAAVIGMGSGLSTHTILSNPRMESVDTIEIEPAMVEAANGFRPRVELAYSDPRSHIYIDDAKTFFSNHNKRYDIILSEPSNPWVSGTASLFTEEFYRFLPRYLTDQGILVQWIQLYELNVELVASVIKALSQHFKDYAIYSTTDYDILIIASNTTLPPLSNHVFESASLRKELNRIFIGTLTDIDIRQVADRRSIEPLFFSYPIRANSDYYPVLDLGAAKARFFGDKASAIVTSSFATLPAKRILSNRQPLINGQPTRTEATILTLAYFSQIALNLKNKFLLNQDYSIMIPMKYQTTITNLSNIFIQCQPANREAWIDTLMDFTAGTQPFLNNSDMQTIWATLQNTSCFARLSPMQKDWLALLDAIGQRQFQKMAGLSEWLLKNDIATKAKHRDFLLSAALLGNHMTGQNDKARAIWRTYNDKVGPDFVRKINQRLILTNIGVLPRFDN